MLNLATKQNIVIEWSYTTSKRYNDESNDIELDIIVTSPDGASLRVPAFWAGDGIWRVRFSSNTAGKHSFITECSDQDNHELNGQKGTINITEYHGNNPLYQRGPLRVSRDRRYLEHSDGTPFLWLADTWWMGLSPRIPWPQGFKELARDRVNKGFNVIQIVAGLLPDMPPLDKRCANEGGLPWEPGFAAINPAYFDIADQRIIYLIEQGLVPCIVGCWGYYLAAMGIEKMKRHWRYLIARYGAYPVVWCLAGETAMPYYLTKDHDGEKRFLKNGWAELGSHVRDADPYKRLITTHPEYSEVGRRQLTKPEILDFDMLQTGHSGFESMPSTVRLTREALSLQPTMPFLNAEVNYEGIFGGSWEDVQRLNFWSCVLSGACGHTYGAEGIFQANSYEELFGPSPHPLTWGTTPWEEAYQLKGSFQVGLAKRFLDRYEWWKLEPHQDWVTPAATASSYNDPYCAGIDGDLVIAYFPRPMVWARTLLKLTPGVDYCALYWDPRTGKEQPIGEVKAGEDGWWQVPSPGLTQDWVIAVKRI